MQPEEFLAEVFLETGIQSVAGKHSVFVATSRDLLVGGTLRVLPVDRVILQLPSIAQADPEVVEACHDLVARGYRVAVEVDEQTPLDGPLTSAHVARVDVAALGSDALTNLTTRLRELPARLLATNVQHSGQRDQCAALGFDLFEGYRFTGPEVCRVPRSASSICTRFAC